MQSVSIAAAIQSQEASIQSSSGFPIEDLFAALDNFNLGIAVVDRSFHVMAINRRLAVMHGLPVQAHPGKTLRELLGAVSTKIEPFFERVFSTGQPLANAQALTGLPNRPDASQWIEYYFPLTDHDGRVVEVGTFVIAFGPDLDLQGSFNFAPEGEMSPDPRQELSEPIPQAARQRAGVTCHEPEIDLTCRETDVLRLLASGKSNKEISVILTISVKTVETYRTRIMIKLHAPSLVYLVHYAIRHQIVDLQD